MPRVKWEAVGHQAVVKAQETIRRAKNDAHKDTVKNFGEERRLARLGTKITREQATEQEKYERAVRDVTRAVERNKVSHEAAARALQSLKEKHLGVAAAMKRRLGDEESLAARARKLVGEEETAAQRRARIGREAVNLQRRGKMTREEMIGVLRRLKNEHLGVADAERKASEAAAMRRGEAARIVERNLTPMERYRRDLREVIKLERSGELSTRGRRREVARLKEELRGAATAGNKAFGQSMRAQLGGYLTAAAGVGAAVAGIRDGIQRANQVAAKAAASQMSAADARRGLKLMLLGFSPEQRQATLSFANRLPGELGLPTTLVDNTLKNAISAASGPERAMTFTRSSLRSLRTAPGADAFTGGLLDISNALGVDDPDIAKGFMFSGLQRSRITDISKFSANAPRVITAAMSKGIDPAVATAFYNAITVAAADKDGEVARTAAINVMGRMGKFFADDASKPFGLSAAATDSPSKQLQLLLGDPALGKAATDYFGLRAAGEGGVRGVLEQLNPEARKVYSLSLRDLRDRDSLRRRGQRGDSVLNRGRFEPTAELNRRVTALGEMSEFASGQLLTEENEARLADFVYKLRREQGVRGTANIAAGQTPRLANARDLATLLSPSAMINPRGAVGQEMFLRMGAEVTAREAADFLSDELLGLQNYRRTFGGETSGAQIEIAQQQLALLSRIAEASEEQNAAPPPPANPRAE